MRRTAKIAHHLSLLSAVTLAVALGFWLASQALTTYLYVPEVHVPALVGKTSEEAILLVQRATVTLESVERGFHSSAPEGQIFWQDPPPGKRVKRGRPIRILVSFGAHKVVVPDLSGRPLHMAQVTLEAASLRVDSMTEEYDDVIKKRSVIRQVPAAGALLQVDSPITLVISRGPKPVEMPTLVGRSLDDIRVLLEKFGLAVAQVTRAASSDANIGIVLAQAPLPGTMVPPGGTRIFLVIGVSSTVEGVSRTSSSGAEPQSVQTPVRP